MSEQTELVRPAAVQDEIDALGATIRAEHQQVVSLVKSALAHAIACGEALLALHELILPDEWASLSISISGLTQPTISKYMRLARYQIYFNDPNMTVQQAMTYLAVEGAPQERRRRESFPHDAAQRMRDAGMTDGQIADALNVSMGAVWEAFTPRTLQNMRRKQERDRRRRQQKLWENGQKALAREEEQTARAQLMSQTFGQPLAEAYGLVRKALSVLDRGKRRANYNELAAINNAIGLLHGVEDELVRGIRAARTSG